MTVTFERHIVFDGNHNFRDLGGYLTADGRQIRWRRLFRSDGLHGLTVADIARLQEMQARTIFDLRSAHELETDGLGSIYEHGVIHRHTPFFPGRDSVVPAERELNRDFATLYLSMLDTARPAIREIFTTLAEEGTYPAIYHCSAGKDRTGVLTALILRGLGVDDETIVADYALSSQYITPHLEARLASAEFADRYPNITPEMLRAEPETMRRLLATFDDQFGPGAGAVLACGVTEAQIEAVRAQLLED